MYYLIKFREKVRVPPSLFVMEKNEAIKTVLKEKYAKRINPQWGYVVDIAKAKALSKGLVMPGDPNVYYDTEYEAIVFTIEVNEVFRGKVMDIMEFGAFVNIGPFEGLLHISQISREKFAYNRKSKSLVSTTGKKEIKKGDIVYVKVSTVSMKGSLSDVKISLTMRGDGLGKLEWLMAEKKKSKKKKKEKG